MDKIKKGLGRGLSSLIGETKVESQKNQLSISDLVPNKYQPRKIFDESNLVELTNSIKERGMIQPIIVRKSNVGVSVTTVTSFDDTGSIVGVGTSFADNVYQVARVEGLTTSVSGVTTNVRRLFVDVDQFASGYSGITTSGDGLGEFSWGKIEVVDRGNTNTYNAYTQSGVGLTEGSGITTSAMVVRSNFLKFTNYI